ncbi:MAG: MFS transporter [Candidatus Hodarchaeota archaeon]
MNRKSFEIGMTGLLHALLHIYWFSLSPMYLLIQEEFHVSTLQLGLIGSMLGITTLLQGPVGYVVERFGRKRFTATSILIYSVAVFGFGMAPSVLVLLAFVFIAGLGASGFHPASYSLVALKMAKKHLSKAIAYHTLGGFVGGAIGTVLIALSAVTFGWRLTLQTLAVVGIFIVCLFWIVVREEQSTAVHRRDRTPSPKTMRERAEFRFTTPLLIMFLVTFLSSFAYLSSFMPLFLSKGFSKTVASAGILTAVMQGAGCIAMVISGIIGDRLDKVYTVAVFSVATGILRVFLALGAQQTLPLELLVLLLCFQGFAQNFTNPTKHTLVAILSSGRPQGIGFEFTAMSLGSILAAPLIGYVSDVFGIPFAFITTSIFAFLSGIVVLFVKKTTTARAHLSKE